MPIFHLELNWKLTHTSQPEKDTNDTAGSEFTPNIKSTKSDKIQDVSITDLNISPTWQFKRKKH